MKIKTTSLVITLLLFLSVMTVRSQDKPPVIEVSGSAVIKVVPDMIKWKINIIVDNDNVRDVKSLHDGALRQVLSVLKENGITSDKIHTFGMAIHKNSKEFYKESKNFTIKNFIECISNDISSYDQMLEELVNIDYVFTDENVLGYSKAEETESIARIEALKNAREKAIQMAEVFGQGIGKPLIIQEAQYYSNIKIVSGVSTSKEESLFEEGTMRITSSVKVTFELLNK